MNTTLSDQIKAIQESRKLLNHFGVTETPDLDARLNDAGSTIAALNLNPSRESNAKLIGIVNPDQSREEYSQKLIDLVADFLEGKPEKEKEFLAMTYDRIQELEKVLLEANSLIPEAQKEYDHLRASVAALEERHAKLQKAYGQYCDFVHGYASGSASISEVNAAQSEFLILLNGNDN